MKITFLVPPALDNQPCADRVAGCARSLYPIVNVFELLAAASVESLGIKVVYKNFPINKLTPENFNTFIKTDNSDVYVIYGVNLTKETDLIALRKIKNIKNEVDIIFYGPAPTYYVKDYLLYDRTYVVRGEPEQTIKELADCLRNS